MTACTETSSAEVTSSADQHVRLGGQGGCDGDPLPLAAGQLIGLYQWRHGRD